jgi:hypothetical protein
MVLLLSFPALVSNDARNIQSLGGAPVALAGKTLPDGTWCEQCPGDDPPPPPPGGGQGLVYQGSAAAATSTAKPERVNDRILIVRALVMWLLMLA